MNWRSVTLVAATIALLFTGCSRLFWELEPEVSEKACMEMNSGHPCTLLKR